MRVLIVEDKRSIAEYLGRALEGEGHSVAFAYDGEYGSQFGRTNEFDVMIVDIMLPRMDGINIIRKLREDRMHTQTLSFRGPAPG